VTTSLPDDTERNTRTFSYAERRILAISVATFALYAVNCLVQGAFFNGMVAPSSVMGAGHPASRADLAWQLAIYAALTVSLFSAYATVLSMCRRGELTRGRARICALTVPCILNLLLVVWVPRLSQDVFSYIAQGFLGALPGGNPFVQPAEEVRGTSLGPGLAAFGWDAAPGITPYGIVWTQIEIAIMRHSGGNVVTALLLMKTVVVAASLGTAFLIWSFLGRVHPSAQLLGTLTYLWNPLILVEFAGESHNDAVMMFFVVAALAACGAGRPAASVIAQVLGMLSKYLPVLFFLAQLVYLWRTRQGVARLALQTAAALFIVAAIAAVLYAPLWAGAHTFDGILRRELPLNSATPFGGINWILRCSPLSSVATPLTVGVVTLPVLTFVAWTSLRVRDVAGLARAFAWISLAYVLVASPDYWPWYACMPVTLLALAESERLLWLVMLMSFVARLCSPLEVLPDHGFLSMPIAKGSLTGLGTTLPLTVLLIWIYRQRRQPR
jgi:hypothetical protein